MARKNDVEDVGIKGIKRRKSDGKYLVTLDFGRQEKLNKKTNQMELKQVKTTKVVSTLKEAKALLGENNTAKRKDKITNTTGKLYIEKVIADYKDMYEEDWSDSYRMQINGECKHIINYFKNKDIHKVDTLDIEKYFAHCHENLGLSWNTIQKHKTLMKALWKYMKKGQKKYGIRENVVLDADLGGSIEKFKATALKAEQVNTLLEHCLLHEDDKSTLLMVGLPVLTGLRRSELCGLRYKDINMEDSLLNIENARVQISTGSIEKLPKTDVTRVSAIPKCLKYCLEISKEQQEDWLQRSVTSDDYVYRTKINCVKGYEMHPGKVSRRFNELQKRMNKRLEKEGKDPIPHVRLHDLRHTFISLCLNGGKVNPFQVSANVGHVVEDNTTTKVYWQDDGSRQQIIDFIDNLITVDFEGYMQKSKVA